MLGHMFHSSHTKSCPRHMRRCPGWKMSKWTEEEEERGRGEESNEQVEENIHH